MQNQPPLLSSLLLHADRFHGDTEIVSRLAEGAVHRQTYGTAARRAQKLADRLRKLGVVQGDRVGTLAWNTHRHFEIEYAVTGMGAVWHAINPRLIPAQISYIATHAEDKVLFIESSFVPMIEKLAGELPTVGLFVLLVDRAAMPSTTIPNVRSYEDLVDEGDENFTWPSFDELSASSLFSTRRVRPAILRECSIHIGRMSCIVFRSAALHSGGLTAFETVLPMTPMFHANGAWRRLGVDARGSDGRSQVSAARSEVGCWMPPCCLTATPSSTAKTSPASPCRTAGRCRQSVGSG
jgi:fatty-acyl-CoA synthase